MNSDDVGRRIVGRIKSNGQRRMYPVLTWWGVMIDHWEMFDAIVASQPHSAPYRQYGWRADENGADIREKEHARMLRLDDKLTMCWAALGRLRAVSDQPYDSSGAIEAMNDFSAAIRLPSNGENALRPLYMMSGQAPLWRGLKPKWRDLEMRWVKPHDNLRWSVDLETLLFKNWIAWETLADEHRYQSYSYEQFRHPEPSYHFYQLIQRHKYFVAVIDALRDARLQLLNGVSEIDWEPLHTALEKDKGNFDADGNIIWYPQLDPFRQHVWDAYVASCVKQ